MSCAGLAAPRARPVAHNLKLVSSSSHPHHFLHLSLSLTLFWVSCGASFGLFSLPFLTPNFLAPGLLTGATLLHKCSLVLVAPLRPAFICKQVYPSPLPSAASTCLSPSLLFPRSPSLSPPPRSLLRSHSLPSPNAPSSAMILIASGRRCFRLRHPA